MEELRVVLPGEEVSLSSLTVGPGLYMTSEDCNSAVVSIAGLLRDRDKKKTWVDYSSKRYVPFRGDRVVGVVKGSGRTHRLDIGCAMLAILSELAFEGATKRNKPSLQAGELVYANVIRAHKDTEVELSCVDATSGKANGLGPLPANGYLLHCSLGLARTLLSPSCPILNALGQYFKFEVTVGLNGYVWVQSHSVTHTIAVCNALRSSEHASPKDCQQIAEMVARSIQGRIVT